MTIEDAIERVEGLAKQLDKDCAKEECFAGPSPKVHAMSYDAEALRLVLESASLSESRHQDRLILLKELARVKDDKDAAYRERNQVVAALAKCFPAGIARTDIPGWDPAWHGCVFIDLPTGQASWHFHDSDAALFDGLPAYDKPWDGHTTPEKYERLAALERAKEPRVVYRGRAKPTPVSDEEAEEPRVYALGEGERKTLKQLLDDVHGQSYDSGEPEHCKNGYCHALTAALALQEPFTVEEANVLAAILHGHDNENLLRRIFDEISQEEYMRKVDTLYALTAKLRAYIEARKESKPLTQQPQNLP